MQLAVGEKISYLDDLGDGEGRVQFTATLTNRERTHEGLGRRVPVLDVDRGQTDIATEMLWVPEEVDRVEHERILSALEVQKVYGVGKSVERTRLGLRALE